MRVLDASALLALLNDEQGADVVSTVIDGGVLSTVTLAEVLGKAVDVGVDPRTVQARLAAAGVVVTELTPTDAVMAAGLRRSPGGTALSLGDRCCLAVALREPNAEVYTADRAWAMLDLPLRTVLIR
ncbi:PIN domain-containing protein [uncultured Williamsia sp.]|uniref:PIN domain-containing protein n=1 Tax=uncultured Williamsia sp. TaxID=259311 RepID=UPI00260A2106|nr:PIN domain-containing protein [uncultured Williamsia sp.]